MRVSINNDIAARMARSEIPGPCDTISAHAMKPDPAAASRYLIGRAIGGTVIDHNDLATRRKRVVEVFYRPLQFMPFVAADHDHTDFIGHAAPARHSLSAHPRKTPGHPFPQIGPPGIPDCQNDGARSARNENGAQGMLRPKAFLSEHSAAGPKCSGSHPAPKQSTGIARRRTKRGLALIWSRPSPRSTRIGEREELTRWGRSRFERCSWRCEGHEKQPICRRVTSANRKESDPGSDAMPASPWCGARRRTSRRLHSRAVHTRSSFHR